EHAGVEPRSGVLDLDSHLRPFDGRAYADATAGRRVPERVVEQVADGLADAVGVDLDHHMLGGQLELDAALAGRRQPDLTGRPEQRPQVDRGPTSPNEATFLA